jgi:hypothetical protein
MKSVIIALFMSLVGFTSMAQTTTADKMKKHSGETLEVKVIKVGETNISFKYPGEDAEQTIGKYAVAEITYGSSGRKETITEKIIVSDESDWEKVVIISDASEVVGLKKGEEVKGKTAGLISYNTAGSADKKATKRLMQAAAEMGAPFILMTSDKSDGFGVKQSMKKGFAYTYK